MKALDLVNRFISENVDPAKVGTFLFDNEEDLNDMKHFISWMFSGNIVEGSLQLGKTYLYVYVSDEEDKQDWCKNDHPDMTVNLYDGGEVLLFELI